MFQDELDMHALACIAESCPNLVKLVFFSCDFVENFGPVTCSNRPLVNKPFRKLQVLVCISVRQRYSCFCANLDIHRIYFLRSVHRMLSSSCWSTRTTWPGFSLGRRLGSTTPQWPTSSPREPSETSRKYVF